MKHHRPSFGALVIVASALSLTGCTALMPKSTPEDAGRVMQQAARFQTGAPKNLGSSEQYRKPLKAGQWVAMLARSKRDPNDVTLLVTKVVEARGDTVTIEMETYAATEGAKRAVIQQTMRNVPLKARTAYTSPEDAAALENVQIENVKIMDPEGNVATLPQLPFGPGRIGTELLKASVASGEVRTEPCSTSRFKASKCYLVPVETRILWMSERGTTYAHSAVPIHGVIRTETDSADQELIGFGDKGAERIIR